MEFLDDNFWLVVEPTHLNNNYQSNWIDHFPKDRGENKKYPPVN